MKEEIEKFAPKKEKPVIEELKELKEKEIERMEEDKTYGSPWKNIKPEHLVPEVQEIYDLFRKNQLDVVQEKFQVANTEAEEIKNRERRFSNIEFLHWIDDKINQALSKKTLEEERQKGN